MTVVPSLLIATSKFLAVELDGWYVSEITWARISALRVLRMVEMDLNALKVYLASKRSTAF